MARFWGANAYFQLLPNSRLIGNKVFDAPEKRRIELEHMVLVRDRVRCRVLPAFLSTPEGKLKITMAAYDMTLFDAIEKDKISNDDLQRLVFVVTDMLLAVAQSQLLLMDVHIGNVVIKHFKEALVDVAIIDPGFLHDYSTAALPPHCRSCPFDPRYDLALFSYSLLGTCRGERRWRPVTPLSEAELVAYDAYIDGPHLWRLAVPKAPYRPKSAVQFQKYRRDASS